LRAAVAGQSRVTPVPQLEMSHVVPELRTVPFQMLRPSPEVVPRRSTCWSCRYRVAMYGPSSHGEGRTPRLATSYSLTMRSANVSRTARASGLVSVAAWSRGINPISRARAKLK